MARTGGVRDEDEDGHSTVALSVSVVVSVAVTAVAVSCFCTVVSSHLIFRTVISGRPGGGGTACATPAVCSRYR